MTQRDFPELASAHVAGARLYATRDDLVRDLSLRSRPRIAEVGVALGTFSRLMIEALRPSEFHAFDLFRLHLDAMLWGRPTSEVLQGKIHLDFYRDEMAKLDTPVHVHEGPSGDLLKAIPDAYFDMVYVDGAHDYEGVRQDANEASRTTRPDGVLVFNDYILHDPFIHADYGVVQVVNEMVVQEGWQVIGFGLQKHLFCDIALRRR